MDKEQNKTSFLTAYLREFAKIFTMAILIMSVSVRIFSIFDNDMQFMSTLFIMENTGIPYSTILQIAFFSLIMSAISRFLFSDLIIVKLRYILRIFLFFIATLFVVTGFSIVFKWIPINNIIAWIAFVIAFFISFGIAISLSYLIMKLEDKKYNKLLENYKSSMNK